MVALLHQGSDLDEVLQLVGRIQRQLRLEPLLARAEHMAVDAARAGVNLASIDGMPGVPPLAG